MIIKCEESESRVCHVWCHAKDITNWPNQMKQSVDSKSMVNKTFFFFSRVFIDSFFFSVSSTMHVISALLIYPNAIFRRYFFGMQYALKQQFPFVWKWWWDHRLLSKCPQYRPKYIHKFNGYIDLNEWWPDGFEFLLICLCHKISTRRRVKHVEKASEKACQFAQIHYVLINNYYNFNAWYNDTLWKQLPLHRKPSSCSLQYSVDG